MTELRTYRLLGWALLITAIAAFAPLYVALLGLRGWSSEGTEMLRALYFVVVAPPSVLMITAK